MSRPIQVIIAAMIFFSVQGQKIDDFLPDHPPKTSAQNFGYLMAGVTLQAAGLGLSALSVYLTLDMWEEDLEIGLSGFGLGLIMAAAGTVVLVGSLKNIALEKKAWHEYYRDKRKNKVTMYIEPTKYGIGLVCRF